MSDTMRIVRAILAAQSSVDSGRALNPATVRILLDEIMRLRRMVESNARKANKEMTRNELMDVHRDGGAEGTASGEGDGVRWTNPRLDSIDG